MSTVAQFQAVLEQNGSPAVYHRADSVTPCPCRTPEGYRDPIWHLQHPNEPVCNEAGFLPGPEDIEILVKAFIQPIQTTRATRLRSQYSIVDFGDVEAGDQLGIFPLEYAGTTLNFYDWGASAEDWIEYDGRRYTVVAADMIPDPDGGGRHHWETSLRLISSENL
jgi:hypothetical protein